MNSKINVSAFFILAIATGSLARPSFRFRIPNVANIVNPCDEDTKWEGVGHINPRGGGRLNPFGRDFAANRHNWQSVCPLDSDNDGKTNGEELGDPNCEWQPGSAFNPGPATHPGICEPINSLRCRRHNMWLRRDMCKNLLAPPPTTTQATTPVIQSGSNSLYSHFAVAFLGIAALI